MIKTKTKTKTKVKPSSSSNKPKGIESRITPVADIPVELNILLYGRSGTGKTTLIGSAPKPLLILDIREKGTTSIRNIKDTFVLTLHSWKDFEEAYWFLNSEEGQKFKTIAVDTVTQLQEFALEEIRGSSKGLVSRKTWGEASGLLKSWIMLFRDLPMNVIFTAQDRQTKGGDEDDEDLDSAIAPEVGPYVMPSVAKIMNAAVDIIGNTFIRENVTTKKDPATRKTIENKKIEYCLRIGPHPVYVTKFRTPTGGGDKIPAVLVNPTFKELVNLSLEAGK